jgi:TonB-dependent receptor
MKNQTRRHARLQATPVAAAIALLCASEFAAAQSTAEPAAQTVTVTGIRRGIESAINVKKNADGIVEAISSEDIGKLPDNSIAESISRLPGLSAQRVAGRAQVISVRGLSPDFATTLLNGRELVSTGDNRSVEFDQYPSELLSAVLVYKTPDAGLIGQGLSGTLDMQTIRPLNFGSRVVALNARGSSNSLGSAAGTSANGNRFSASYVDQFANRTLGIVIGYAHQETPIQENQVGLYEPWEVKNTANWPGLPANTTSTGGMKALRRTGKTERDGLMASIEWRPSKEYSTVIDIFSSKAKSTETQNSFETNFDYNGAYPCSPQCVRTPTTINANGTFTVGTISNVYPLVRGLYNKRDDKIDAFGWSNKLKTGDIQWIGDLSYSKATRDELSLENNTQLVPSPQFETVGINIKPNDFSQYFGLKNDYSNPANLILRGTIYGAGYGKTPQVKDELKAIKLAASMPAPAFVSSLFADLEAGLNYTERSKNKVQPEGSMGVGKQGDTAIGSNLQRGSVNLGFANLGLIPAWDVPGAVAAYLTFNPTVAGQESKTWSVKENTTTAFVKANLDSQWGSVPVRGNLGLQVQRTDQSSTGLRYGGAGNDQFTDGKTTNDVLPSANLAFNLGNDQTLRMALAKQVARPRVDQMKSTIEFGVSTAGIPGGSGGNPKLDPWRANAFDVSYEKYFGTKAYVAAAAFYKELTSYIYTQAISNYDFSKLTGGVTVPPLPTTNLGTFTAPYNGTGGKLSGVELSASMPLDLISPVVKGFGITASASFNNSNIKIDLSKEGDNANSLGSTNVALPGLSKNVYSLTAYYEGNGFEVRISQRKRSDFIGEIGDFANNRKLRYVVGESIVDAQVGYNFGEGTFKGLGLLMQVTNLGDKAYQTYTGSRDKPLEYIKWGRTTLVGANYKF